VSEGSSTSIASAVAEESGEPPVEGSSLGWWPEGCCKGAEKIVPPEGAPECGGVVAVVEPLAAEFPALDPACQETVLPAWWGEEAAVATGRARGESVVDSSAEEALPGVVVEAM